MPYKRDKNGQMVLEPQHPEIGSKYVYPPEANFFGPRSFEGGSVWREVGNNLREDRELEHAAKMDRLIAWLCALGILAFYAWQWWRTV